MNNANNAAPTATTNAEKEIVNKASQSEKSAKGDTSAKRKRRDKVEDLMIQHTNVLFNRVKPTLEGEDEYTKKLRKCFDMAVQQKYLTRGKSEAEALDEIGKRVYFCTSNYHFRKWCDKHHYEAFAAATHAVLQGKTKMIRALMDDVMMFGEPKFLDSQYWKEPVFQENELSKYKDLVKMSGEPTLEPESESMAEQ